MGHSYSFWCGGYIKCTFFIVVGLYGMSVGGHTRFVTETAMTAAGFPIENINISGNTKTSEIEILQLLELDGHTSLIAFDISSAWQKLSSLPWIERVELRKIYPNTLEIHLAERQAYAIWQHGSDLSLIDKNGKVIIPLNDNRFVNLPMLVGGDAEKVVSSFSKEFENFPEIKERVKAYVWVASRRWDLYLHSGVIVKLPEDGVNMALVKLFEMEKQYQILERDITAIDLRLPDRMAIRLTAGALARRQEAIDTRAKTFNIEYHGA